MFRIARIHQPLVGRGRQLRAGGTLRLGGPRGQDEDQRIHPGAAQHRGRRHRRPPGGVRLLVFPDDAPMGQVSHQMDHVPKATGHEQLASGWGMVPFPPSAGLPRPLGGVRSHGLSEVSAIWLRTRRRISSRRTGKRGSRSSTSGGGLSRLSGRVSAPGRRQGLGSQPVPEVVRLRIQGGVPPHAGWIQQAHDARRGSL